MNDLFITKIALSRTVSKIISFAFLRRNSIWPSKMAGKRFLEKVTNRLCRYPVGQKFRRNRSISFRFQDKRFFFVLRRNSRWPPKVVGKRFGEKSPVHSADTPRVKNFVEIALSRSVSKIISFCILCRNSRWPPKVAGKRCFAPFSR